MDEKTTDLDVVRARPNRFTWGRVEEIYDIGPYTFVEFLDGKWERSFHIYVDGKDTHTSASDIDVALLAAIGRKHLGPNEGRHMAQAAAKLFGINPS